MKGLGRIKGSRDSLLGLLEIENRLPLKTIASNFQGKEKLKIGIKGYDEISAEMTN